MNNIFAATASDLGRTVAQAKPLLLELNNADTSKPRSKGKWSKKEILGHLMDSASNNHQRFVRAALEGKLVFPAYEQDQLVSLQRFREMDWGFLVDLWTSYNRFLAHILTCLPATAAKVSCKIGKNKPATLGFIAQDYVDHLKHHLNQILGDTFPNSYGKEVSS
ncbi:MAG TPA: DinB family protein [Candidatus Angelobacter sp.]